MGIWGATCILGGQPAPPADTCPSGEVKARHPHIHLLNPQRSGVGREIKKIIIKGFLGSGLKPI